MRYRQSLVKFASVETSAVSEMTNELFGGR